MTSSPAGASPSPVAITGLVLTILALPAITVAQERPERSRALEELAELATSAAVLIDVRTASSARQGSGFLVDPDGIILTNYHVIRDARAARVKLASGDVYERVTVLAEDRRRDIAVLRIAGFELPTLQLGNSDSLRIGAPVVLVGSPLGLENTVSTGILSGRRQEPEGFQLLQVTAPASQGSSGGAVLAADGRVIGIAASQLLAGQNLNFAVPINYARGLLGNLDGQAVMTLDPVDGAPGESRAQPLTSEVVVNAGLRFAVDDFRGYVTESVTALGEDLERRSRVTYRLIQTVGMAEPRIERYLESETTRRTEPFGTRQTVRRSRVRSIVTAEGLRPLSSRGEHSWWDADGWTTATHDVRFEGDRVLGVVTDTAGRSTELDRVVARGIILREVRDLAFATLAADSLLGRSVEFTTFDPWTGQVVEDRYDVLARERTEVAGGLQEVLRVNVASGLENETVLFLQRRPRVALKRVSQDGDETEVVVRLELPGTPR